MSQNNTVELYRGDRFKVDRFEVNKTKDHSLFGQGIYLTNNLEITQRYSIYKNTLDPALGFVSTFKFQKDELTTATINIMNSQDDFFWKLLFENKIKYGIKQEKLEDYILINKINTEPFCIDDKNIYKEIASVLSSYGYKGFSFDINDDQGYCFWDEEWINSRRVTLLITSSLFI